MEGSVVLIWSGLSSCWVVRRANICCVNGTENAKVLAYYDNRIAVTMVIE